MVTKDHPNHLSSTAILYCKFHSWSRELTKTWIVIRTNTIVSLEYWWWYLLILLFLWTFQKYSLKRVVHKNVLVTVHIIIYAMKYITVSPDTEASLKSVLFGWCYEHSWGRPSSWIRRSLWCSEQCPHLWTGSPWRGHDYQARWCTWWQYWGGSSVNPPALTHRSYRLGRDQSWSGTGWILAEMDRQTEFLSADGGQEACNPSCVSGRLLDRVNQWREQTRDFERKKITTCLGNIFSQSNQLTGGQGLKGMHLYLSHPHAGCTAMHQSTEWLNSGLHFHLITRLAHCSHLHTTAPLEALGCLAT